MRGRIGFVIGVAALLAIGCNKSSLTGSNRLIVGEIEGPDTVVEETYAEYSVEASGDTGITYSWAVEPLVEPPVLDYDLPTLNFYGPKTISHLTFTIRVIVTSDRDGPVMREREITVEDMTIWTGRALTWGGTSKDTGLEVMADGLGNVYVTGYFSRTVDFDPGPGIDEHEAGKRDVYLSKFNSSGELLWARTWGGAADDQGWALAVDDIGNAYVTGFFRYVADLDPGPGVDQHITNGKADVFVSKLSPDGELHWVRTWGGTEFDYGHAVAADHAGNVYVSGSYSGIVDLDPGAGIDEYTSNGGYDAFLSKFDSNGEFLWARAWGGADTVRGQALVTDDIGDIFVLGNFAGTADLNPGPEIEEVTSLGMWDVSISKFESAGNIAWIRTWGGTGPDFGDAMTLDGAGNVIITGSFSDSVDFDPGPAVDMWMSNGGFSDVFVSKLDSSGGFLWARTWGRHGTDVGKDIAVDDAGHVYVTGYFSGRFVDFDPGPGVEEHTALGHDAYVSTFDPNGEFMKALTWGGGGWDEAYGIAHGGSGGVYVTGLFNWIGDFDPTPGTDWTHSNGGNDAFLTWFPPDIW